MRSLGYAASSALRPSVSNQAGLQWLNRLVRSRTALAGLCLTMIGGLGYLDYVTGYEQTFLLLYLVPIALET